MYHFPAVCCWWVKHNLRTGWFLTSLFLCCYGLINSGKLFCVFLYKQKRDIISYTPISTKKIMLNISVFFAKTKNYLISYIPTPTRKPLHLLRSNSRLTAAVSRLHPLAFAIPFHFFGCNHSYLFGKSCA